MVDSRFKPARTIDTTMAAWGMMLLRVVVGFVFFMHGQQKLLEMGVAQIGEGFGSQGIPLPEVAAVVVTALETLGGLALILGLLTRGVAALLAIEMLAAALLVHLPNGFFAGTGGVELVLVLGVACLSMVLTGPGAAAVDGLLPRERSQPARAAGAWRQREDFAR